MEHLRLFDAHTLRNWLDFARQHDAGVCFGDAVLVANLITKTKLMKKYLSKVLDKTIYAEDMIYRMMVVNGVELYY